MNGALDLADVRGMKGSTGMAHVMGMAQVELAAQRVVSDTDNPPVILLLCSLLNALLRAMERAVNSALQ